VFGQLFMLLVQTYGLLKARLEEGNTAARGEDGPTARAKLLGGLRQLVKLLRSTHLEYLLLARPVATFDIQIAS
jgi:hypothetical protein